MFLPKALYHLLTNDARVNNIIAGRVFNMEIPEGIDYPAICMWCMVDSSVMALDGNLSKYAQPVWRFDCWSTSGAEVFKLRAAVLNCLQGYHGTVTIDDEELKIYGITFDGGRSVQFKDSADTKVYGWELEMVVAYLEDVSSE